TLIQLLIAAWGNIFGSIPSLLIYGDGLKTIGSHSTILVCLYKASINKYILIEKDWFWYYSCSIWCFSACLNVFSFAVDIEEPNYGTRASSLVCRPFETGLHIFIYLVVSAPLLLLAFIYTIVSGKILFDRWKSYRKKENRFTVMGLGHAIRLWLCGAYFTAFLACTSIPRLFSYFKQPNVDTTLLTIYDYAFSF
ncbi:24509_t:CDS:2, partial [Racocetra persica]